MVIPARFERATPRLGIWCSILLSYGTTWTASIQKARGEAKPFCRAIGQYRRSLPALNPSVVVQQVGSSMRRRMQSPHR